MVGLLEIAAPGIPNPIEWIGPHLDKALETDRDETIEAGRRIAFVAATDIALFTLTVEPEPKR